MRRSTITISIVSATTIVAWQLKSRTRWCYPKVKTMTAINAGKTKFENATPILSVSDLVVSVRYYVETLGFVSADWGSKFFTAVNRDQAGIYLCQGGQGRPGTWVWIGVEDAAQLFEEYTASGARIIRPPQNYPWAFEMHVEDPDGHVLRFGSEPRSDQPLAVAGF